MIWGAAVNLASRVESPGQSGTIQISRSTYDLIKDQFDCESRGTIKVKGEKSGSVLREEGRQQHGGDGADHRANHAKYAFYQR